MMAPSIPMRLVSLLGVRLSLITVEIWQTKALLKWNIDYAKRSDLTIGRHKRQTKYYKG